ncbi:hypothetical protein D3C85_1611470 [compost metagenome]
MHREISVFSCIDVTLEYSVIGKGAPILLFHGGHSSCYEEFGYLPLLTSGYSIITPSLVPKKEHGGCLQRRVTYSLN